MQLDQEYANRIQADQERYVESARRSRELVDTIFQLLEKAHPEIAKAILNAKLAIPGEPKS